jgi:hypothetical protein
MILSYLMIRSFIYIYNHTMPYPKSKLPSQKMEVKATQVRPVDHWRFTPKVSQDGRHAAGGQEDLREDAELV